MLRLRAFRATNEKVVKIQFHPTHPWLVTADALDHVCVWNWEYRQVIYELKAGGVDERRLVGAKLEKLADGHSESKGKPTEAMRGGSVRQVEFYDDDVQSWKLWSNRFAAAEALHPPNNLSSAFISPTPSANGRHFLAVCCENKAIFLDLVSMRGRDVLKQELDNKSLLCMEFLCKFANGEGPIVAFGGSDGVIRVLSMITWKLVSRCTGGHKGSISCLMSFMPSSGEALLVSGASDGLLVIWRVDRGQDSRELVPKLSLKAHDGGVLAVDLSRVVGGAPHLVSIGADKSLAIWDTISFKELRRIKPSPKLALHSVASWCHPRAPNLDILTCVKDSHIWAIEHPTYSAMTRPLCELSTLVPPQVLGQSKKLRVYCMVVHPLQPHLVATGTNVGVIISEFDARALPSVACLPTLSEGREHSAVFIADRELKLLNFQLSTPSNPSLQIGSSSSEPGGPKGDFVEPLNIKQNRKHISTHVPHGSYSVISVSGSGKYVAVLWPDLHHFSIYKISDWSIVDSGSAKCFVWDACTDRFSVLESFLPARVPIIPRGSSSRKAKEAAAAAAQAAAAAASATSSAAVQVRLLLDDGTSNMLTKSLGGRAEPVADLHGGALLGVTYRVPQRVGSPAPLSGIGYGGHAPFTLDNVSSNSVPSAESTPHNFQLYSWETFQPVGQLLPQPEWTSWDQTVEYCAFAYPQYIVISSLRPQFRYLGDVAIPLATGAAWHRRQLFVVTTTTIECVFVDGGVAEIDVETKKLKEEAKMKDARAVEQHAELALITVNSDQAPPQQKVSLRPPLLQVVRLASFQHSPSVPPFLTLPGHTKTDASNSSASKKMDEKMNNEVAVGGGGLSVAVSRFPSQQRRPVGPLVVVGVKDGVLWLIDRYMCAHALSLSHPGILCRCLTAYGDAISAVKWASWLGREHHDDLAQFMLGMGYATEALHLPGLSKRLEFDLAMQSNELRRALQCLLILSSSREVGHDGIGLDTSDIFNKADKKENYAEAVRGIVKFSREFLDLIDAADATAHADISRESLNRLAIAGSIKGALSSPELRALSLRLANHGEFAKLRGLINNLISYGSGQEAAFAAALLGDNALMEKAWQDTGMLAEAVLHAHAHGRSTLSSLALAWNKSLQQDGRHTAGAIDTAAAAAGVLETGLKQQQQLLEVLPPGVSSLSALITSKQGRQSAAHHNSAEKLQHKVAEKPLLQLEGPPPPSATTTTPQAALLPHVKPDVETASSSLGVETASSSLGVESVA